MNLSNWESITDNEKGVRLGMFLAKNDLSDEDYLRYIGSWDMALFNVKRFKNYIEKLQELSDGWYWVETEPDYWFIAYYDGEMFRVLSNDYFFTELVSVDTREIVREEESSEG